MTSRPLASRSATTASTCSVRAPGPGSRKSTSWRYPKNVDRSVLIGVNPPGHFIYNGAILDQQIEHYTTLCAQDPTCRAGTGNLAESMRHTAANMPRRWLFLPIKRGNVLLSTQFALAETISAGSPLVAPVALNSWISAAHGDPSGLWLMSLLSSLIFPQSITWGQADSAVQLDASAASRYFSSTAGHGSIIGDPGSDLLWGDGETGRRLARQPQPEPVPDRAGIRCPDAAHRRDGRRPDAGPERHQRTAAPPTQRASGHLVRARAHHRLLELRSQRGNAPC